MSNCKWTSKYENNNKCHRNSLDNEDYCLFHKKEKNNLEATIFSFIINSDLNSVSSKTLSFEYFYN